MLLYGHDAAMARWAGDRLGITSFGPCAAIGVLKGGNIVAAAVYHQFRPPTDIEGSFVTVHKGWATPQNVRGLLGYPFVQLGCKRITAITKSKNQPIRAFLCRLGFRQEGYHPDAFVDDDAVSFGLLREDAARWLAEDMCHRKKFAGSSPDAIGR